MPVDDHPIHEKTRIDDTYRYGCHNREPFKEAYSAINRFAGSTGHSPIWWLERIRIPFTMSRDCKYDLSQTDPNCQGCKHRK